METTRKMLQLPFILAVFGTLSIIYVSSQNDIPVTGKHPLHNHHSGGGIDFNVLPYNCTSDEAGTIAKYFIELNKDGSNCPNDPWFLDFQDIDPNSDKVFVNVGFNKGYNYAQWINVWASWTGINSKTWHEGLVNGNQGLPADLLCGMCDDCHTPTSTPRKNTTAPGTLYAVGVDLNRHNINLVNKGIVNFTMTSKEFGSVIIHNVFGAASNTSGRMWISDCGAGAWVSHYTMILVKNDSSFNLPIKKYVILTH